MPSFDWVKRAPDRFLLASPEISLDLEFAGIGRQHTNNRARLTLIEVGGSTQSIPDLGRWIPLVSQEPGNL
jgi:hypothetical protein